MEARRRLRRRKGLPSDAVHAAWLGLLRHLWQERNRCGTRVRTGSLPDRLRHRGRSQRAAWSWRRGQRHVSQRRRLCWHGRALSVRAGQGQRSGSRAWQLPRVRRDPDGHGWLFQEVTKRLEGRIDPATTTFASASDLASALRRAEHAHGAYEATLGKGRDENWADWYAAYMVAEQSGAKLSE